MTQRKVLVDFDKLNSVGARKVGNAAMACLTGVQDFTKEEQIAGAAVTLMIICERYNMNPEEAFRVSKRIVSGSPYQGEFKAAKMYAKEELS